MESTTTIPLQQLDGIMQRLHQNLLHRQGRHLGPLQLQCPLGQLLELRHPLPTPDLLPWQQTCVPLRRSQELRSPFPGGDQLSLLRQQLSPSIPGVSDASSDPFDGEDNLFLVDLGHLREFPYELPQYRHTS